MIFVSTPLKSRKDFHNMFVCSESASCKACEAAKDAVYFS